VFLLNEPFICYRFNSLWASSNNLRLFSHNVYKGWPNCGSRVACGSLSFPKNYIFIIFYFYCKMKKYCKVLCYFCKSFQKELCDRSVDLNKFVYLDFYVAALCDLGDMRLIHRAGLATPGIHASVTSSCPSSKFFCKMYDLNHLNYISFADCPNHSTFSQLSAKCLRLPQIAQ